MAGDSTKNVIIYAVAYGAIAALLNTFVLVDGYGALTFHFGQLAVFLCLLTRGFRTAVFVGIVSSLCLAFATENPYFVLTLLGELIFVTWCYNRGVALFVSDILYWVLIGILECPQYH